jgi:RNA polymerase sigma factor (sigma-70 family)
MSTPKSSHSPDDTPALVHATLAGDQRAATLLVRRLLLPILDAAVSKYLSANAKRHFDKEDTIQEVFLHLYADNWARLKPYDPKKGTLANYVRKVAKNWIHDHGRRLPPPEPMDDTDKNLAPDSSPESKTQKIQSMERVMAALDDEELLLFRWVHLEDLAVNDIAARLEISVDATYKRIQRTDAKVKAVLSNSGDSLHRVE